MLRFSLFAGILCMLVTVGCSDGVNTTPTTPPIDLEIAGDISLSSDSGPSESQTALWGYYDLFFDFENMEITHMPNRTIMYSVNIVHFLNMNPTDLQFSFNSVTPGTGYMDIDMMVAITHPLDNEKFVGYDVKGVFIANGTAELDANNDILYAEVGTDQMLTNPDGYTRWFNPVEFTTSGIFGYTQGVYASSGYSATATLNPYKYFGEGLGATDGLWTYLNSGDPTVGHFLNATTNSRQYKLRFMTPDPGIKYGYAIMANWAGGDPSDPPAFAVEAPAIGVDDHSDLWYVSDTEKGGNIDLEIYVFDRGMPLVGGVMEEYQITIESTLLIDPYVFTTVDMTPILTTTNYNVYAVTLPPDNLVSNEGNEYWVIVEYPNYDYSNPFGVPNMASTENLCSYMRHEIIVDDLPPMDLTITYPNGGEDFNQLDMIDITWTSDYLTGQVKIEYSKDNFNSDIHTIAAATDNDGTHPWEVPAEPSGTVKIRMSSVDYPGIWDVSDAYFTIIGPWVAVDYPNGGEEFEISDSTDVTWYSANVTGNVSIEYSKDNFVSDFHSIGLHVSNSGSYPWTIPDDTSTTVKVRVSSDDFPSATDSSDSFFTILEPSITVLTPNGGEFLESNKIYEVTWESESLLGNVDIEYSTDNFVSDIGVVALDTPNDGSAGWNYVPCVYSNNVRIRVSSTADPAVYDISDDDFTIVETGWLRSLGSVNYDRLNIVDTDTNGNIFAFGTYGSGLEDTDPWLLKFSPCGTLEASAMWGSTYYDSAMGMSVAPTGHIFVTGSFFYTVDFDPGSGTDNHTSAGSSDIYISKFTNYLVHEWTITIGGSSSDRGQAINAHSIAQPWVTGYFTGFDIDFDPGTGFEYLHSEGDRDVFIARYDTNGNFIYAGNIGGVDDDYGNAIDVDTSHNVYFTGFVYGDNVDLNPGSGYSDYWSEGGRDVFLVKLTTTGSYEWAEAWGGIGEDIGYGIAVDSPDVVYVTGQYENTVDFNPDTGSDTDTSEGGSDVFVNAFELDGTQLGSVRWGNVNDDIGYDVNIDDYGNLYVVGRFLGTTDFDPGGGIDAHGPGGAFLSRFNAYNLYLFDYNWSRTWGNNDDTWGRGVSCDSDENIFIVGKYEGTVEFAQTGAPCSDDSAQRTSYGYDDMFLVKYMPFGCW